MIVIKVTMQFFIKLEAINNGELCTYYWTGKCWSGSISAAKDYGTKGNANRAAKMLERYHNGNIQSVAVKLPLFQLGGNHEL